MGGREMGRGMSGHGKPDNSQYKSFIRNLSPYKTVKK